jgi:hypothetical protein
MVMASSFLVRCFFSSAELRDVYAAEITTTIDPRTVEKLVGPRAAGMQNGRDLFHNLALRRRRRLTGGRYVHTI